MMQAAILAALVFVSAELPTARGFPNGAPEYVCNAMTPSHSGGPVENPPPFTVTVSSASYKAGLALTVQIVSAPGKTFEGFLIQARPVGNRDSNSQFGQFTAPAGTKAVCGTSGLTQTQRLAANSVAFDWITDSVDVGDIVFRATVVETYSTWYKGVDSNVIAVAVPTTTTTTSTTTTTTTTIAPAVTPAPTTTAATTTAVPQMTPTTTTTTTTAQPESSQPISQPPPPPPPTTSQTTTTTSTPTVTNNNNKSNSGTNTGTNDGQTNGLGNGERHLTSHLCVVVLFAFLSSCFGLV